MITPHVWQEIATEKFVDHDGKSFLLEVTTGGGKTVEAAFCAKRLIDNDEIDFVVIVVPQTTIKGNANSGFLSDWSKVGIQITSSLRCGNRYPADFQGGVVTYQALPGLVGTIEIWKRSGARLFVIFDEVHHLHDGNVWGQSADRIAACAVRVLAMTGTPFRGDGRRISFVNYNDDEKAIADYSYTYSSAVRDGVCLPVNFITDDGVAEFIKNEEQCTVRISEAEDDDDASSAAKTIFGKNSDYVTRIIERADLTLEDYRSWDNRAGGLIVCRPGMDEQDNRYLHAVASVVKECTGDDPELAFYEDTDSDARIERFRRGSQRWICAVRKISEGVDIKRLRVCLIAHRITTELLFRQIVGRIVRVNDKDNPGDATVIIPKFPDMVQWAKRIRKEAEAGLKERDVRKTKRPIDVDPPVLPFFLPVSATHEPGGAVSFFGEQYTTAEINTAEKYKRGDATLAGTPVTTIAHILRKAGVPIDETENAILPLQVRKDNCRREINKLVKNLAIRMNRKEPDFALVWKKLHSVTGARCLDDLFDNHTIDEMEKARDTLLAWIVSNDGVKQNA